MVKPAAGYQPLACSSPEAVQITGTVAAFGSSNSLGPCDFKDFVAPSHTTNDHCVRFAVVVTFPNTTLVTRRALPLTWAGLSPAGSRQLRLAHCYSFIAVDFHHILLASLPAHSLALQPAHSRGHQSVTVIRRLQTFRLLHACSGCFRLEPSPGGACTRWKAPPCHGARGNLSLAEVCQKAARVSPPLSMSERPTSWGWTPPLSLAINAFSESGT